MFARIKFQLGLSIVFPRTTTHDFNTSPISITVIPTTRIEIISKYIAICFYCHTSEVEDFWGIFKPKVYEKFWRTKNIENLRKNF